MPTLADRVTGLAADPEFRLLSRYWTGALWLDLGAEAVRISFDDGAVVGANLSNDPPADEPGEVGISAPSELWDRILQPVPERFCNDIAPAQALGLRVLGHEETYWQYYPAIRRLVDLLRETR